MNTVMMRLVCCAVALSGVVIAGAVNYSPESVSATLALKVPGNPAEVYSLGMQKLNHNYFDYEMVSDEKMPVSVFQKVEKSDRGERITVFLTALEDVYFHYGQKVKTGFQHNDCQFYLPGFWYRRNLRSPKEAPSFHTSDSWVVREDRLSSPLTGIFNETNGESMSVIRIASYTEGDALTTHKEGEVILSGKTSVGYTGFENMNGTSCLSFGFPYQEAPKTYIRKLTLAPAVEAFQKLSKGETISIVWELREDRSTDFSQFVQQAWEYCYDTYLPQPVETPYSADKMKEVMSNFFIESYVSGNATDYFSGEGLRTATCESVPVAEVGFVGRTLLNAFNALEYGEMNHRTELVSKANAVFDSYLRNGFSDNGFFNERVDYHRGDFGEVHSIRRQSEGIYALFHYLQYEKEQGRKHPEWEKRMKAMLDMFLKLQNEDGSFPRKFKDDFTLIDKSGGSTPSATLPLVMGYKYFKDKRYLASAKRTVDYLEKELISKADYFSSTLDANCEDKEASLYASTAAYYLALVSKGAEREHYAALAKKSAYFALSWYYTWDVPFAPGQMLGDLGLKTRGWGNVSVENNHIDVFIFEFATILDWLSKEYNEPRFSRFAEVVCTSMRQLLPYKSHLCGIAKTGYYPEVVQHTNWDYGRNGKGFYNDIFAPGWTVASLWELFSPGRAERFLK